MVLQFLEIDLAVELEFRVENSREVARWSLVLTKQATRTRMEKKNC